MAGEPALNKNALLSRWGFRWVAVFMLAACVLVPQLAFAQAGQPSAADRAESHKQLIAGEKAAKDGKWDDALAAYEKAHATAPSGATSVRVARAHYELDHKLKAYEAYRETLDKFSKSIFGAEKKKAEERLAELTKVTGALTVSVGESGAAVSIDGRTIGSSPVSAAIRVLVGPRVVKVRKPGFADYDKTVNVGPDEKVTVAVELQKASTTGTIRVVERDEKEMRVLLDGLDVGSTPYEAEIAAGAHEVAGTSSALSAPVQSIEIKAGETTEVTLVADIDGESKGEGSFTAEVEAGKHHIQVKREGYELFEKHVNLEAGDVFVETVTLRRSTGVVKDDTEQDWRFDGLYGGIHLSGYLLPAGTGNSLDSSCDSLGAATCDNSMPLGGGFSGYVGWGVAPLGLELYLVGMADISQGTASFDGQPSSDVNPLVSAPARDEDFTIGRFGGGGAIRARVLVPFDRVRLTAAGGVGLAVKRALLARDATSATDQRDALGSEDVGYVSPALSFDVAAQYLIAGTTALALGIDFWLETAGDGVTTESDNRFLAKEGTRPSPIATPEYDVASGTQFFFGPYLGLQFGP